MAAIRAGDLVLLLVAAAGLYTLLRRRYTPSLAALGPVLLGLVYYTVFDYSETAQAESYALPFSVWLVYAVLCWREAPRAWWWAGLAGGCVGALVLVKTPFVLLGLLVLLAPRRASRLALFAGCALLPIALSVLYFASRGGLSSLVDAVAIQRVYAENFEGSPWHVVVSLPTWLAAFVRHRPYYDALLLVSLITLGWARKWPERRVLAWWLLLSALVVLVQWRLLFYHYVVVIAPLAAVSAAALGELWQCRSASSSAVRLIPLVLLGLLVGLPLACDVGRFRVAWLAQTGQLSQTRFWELFAVPGYFPFANTGEVASYVAAHTAPSDRIIVYGHDPAVYLLSGRLCATRYPSTVPLYSPPGSSPVARDLQRRWREEHVRQAMASRPSLIVVHGRPWAYGLTANPAAWPTHISLAGTTYQYATHFTIDRIYRRLGDVTAKGPPRADRRVR